MGKSAILVGIILVIFGAWLTSLVVVKDTPPFVLIYSLLSIALGIALIILYKAEDTIEERKDLKTKKSK